MRSYRFTLVLLLFMYIYQVLTANEDSYIAAVVEYAPVYSPQLEPEQIVCRNTENYIQFIKNASAKNADIIVFPEMGINGYNLNNNLSLYITIPSVADNVSPCDFTTLPPVLVSLSCAARDHNIYVVVNLAEKYFNKTSNQLQYFNTNVAFDRNGTIVARYRGYNLDEQKDFMKPGSVEYAHFYTDFDVLFGMFICYDLIFAYPSVILNRVFEIQHFVYSAAWFSKTPFLTALQAQWGWAYGLDVVLLAAGYNRPQMGISGSGIYQGRFGALDYYMADKEGSKLLVSAVLKNQPLTNKAAGNKYQRYIKNQYYSKNNEDVEFENTISHCCNCSGTDVIRGSQLTQLSFSVANLNVYETRKLLPPGTCQDSSTSYNNGTAMAITLSVLTTICQGSLCCKFYVKMSNMFENDINETKNRGDDYRKYYYRLAVFDGVEQIGTGTAGLQVCAIISCIDETTASCGKRADDNSANPRRIIDITYGDLIQTGTIFELIDIASFIVYNNTLVFPQLFISGSGDSYGAVIPSDAFDYERLPEYNDSTVVNFNTRTQIPNLITAGIYARQYYRDGGPVTVPESYTASSNVNHLNIVILVMSNKVLLYSMLKKQ